VIRDELTSLGRFKPLVQTSNAQRLQTEVSISHHGEQFGL